MNKAAQALGRLGKDKPKNISAHERERRRKALELVRKHRWPKKTEAQPAE